MYDDVSSITEYGEATMGLHAVNYNAYMNQVDDYRKEIAELDKEYADDPLNQDYLDRRQELVDSMRDAASSAKDEKDAIKDMVSDGYDSLLEYMNKIIDKRKEMLQQAKDMYDYEKNIAQQTKEIASLEKQLSVYSGDDSEESRATIQKLKVSLEEARENLEETEYDKFISDQEKMFDKIVSETEEWIEERLEATDELLIDIIEATNNSADTIKTTLESIAKELGLELSQDMDSIWSTNGEFDSVVSMYGDEFENQATTTNGVLSDIESFIGSMANNTESADSKENKILETIGQTLLGDKSGKLKDLEISQKEKSSTSAASTIDRLSMLNDELLNSIQSASSSGQELAYLISSEIEDRIEDRYDSFVLLSDSINMNATQLNALTDAFLATQASLIDDYKYVQPSSIVKSSSDINNNVEMSITLPNVKNYEEFKYELQHDKNFEKVIQSMTLGAMTGKNSLSKLAI